MISHSCTMSCGERFVLGECSLVMHKLVVCIHTPCRHRDRRHNCGVCFSAGRRLSPACVARWWRVNWTTATAYRRSRRADPSSLSPAHEPSVTRTHAKSYQTSRVNASHTAGWKSRCDHPITLSTESRMVRGAAVISTATGSIINKHWQQQWRYT